MGSSVKSSSLQRNHKNDEERCCRCPVPVRRRRCGRAWLMPDTDTATTLDMATTDTTAILMLMDMDTVTTSTARDPPMLRLSPPLSLKPMLMLTTDTDTVILDMLTTDTTVILMPTMDTTATTTARDPLMLSPPPLPSPDMDTTATTDMLTTDITDIPMLMDMDTATTTARDPLMLRPLPLPSPDMYILDMLITDTTAILMPTVVTTDMAIIINLLDYLLRVEDC